MIQLREYQQQAVDKAVDFLTDSKARYNGIIVSSKYQFKYYIP